MKTSVTAREIIMFRGDGGTTFGPVTPPAPRIGCPAAEIVRL